MSSTGHNPPHRLCHYHYPHRCHHHHHRHHHHHHHHRHHHHHNHHHHCLHNHRFLCQHQGFHNATPLLPQNPEFFVPFTIGDTSNAVAAEFTEADSSAAQIPQELECPDLDEEEDDEPVFVLTDEWRELFARSEARRQLEKKQRKKGKK